LKKIITAAIALTLMGCGARPNASICEPVVDPASATSIEDGLTLQRDPAWQRKRADACVHREAYTLAASSDPAEVVAKAVGEACEANIDASARLTAAEERDPLGIRQAGDQTIDARITEIKAAYERFALLKVVEGRAGNCRG
jgi:hypothetical protein